QVSVPLQNIPSLQAELVGSLPLQSSCASRQVSLQSPSPSGPGQGSPAWTAQLPEPSQVSAPLQNVPSLHAVPTGSLLQVPSMPAMLHDWQVGQLALPQQTPSTQLPLVHSLPPPQVRPSSFFTVQ